MLLAEYPQGNEIGQVASSVFVIFTFHVRRSRGEVYNSHGRLCVCLSLAAFPHYCTDPDVTWGNGRGAF